MMTMSAETKFTLILIAIGAGAIAAKGPGYVALFETCGETLAGIIYTDQIYSTFLSVKLLQL
jgi:hypothetical protein